MHIRGEITSEKLTLSWVVRSRPESLWWIEVDFWPIRVHFRRGPPTIFRKHMPWGIGTESLGMIRCIFAENGPLEGGIESSFSDTGWGAKGDFRWIFYPNPYIFEGGPHTIFRKHMPSGMGTESLGMIGCIFAENGPLEGGIESNFSGTVWGAKGDFRWIFDPNPCIFEGAPTIFRKHMPSGMGTDSLGTIECIFAENGPLEGGIESSFRGTGWGAKGDFMRYSYLYLYIFESRTHTFFESTCPELYAQQSWEWSDAYSWRNDLWKVNFKRVCKKPAGVLMVIWSGFLAPKHSFSKGAPTIFRKHMPSGMGTENLGMIGCIFAENGPLEGGIESSFWGTHLGAKGDFRWIFDPHPCLFEGGPPPFSESTCPQVWAQKVWGWSDVYSWRMGL